VLRDADAPIVADLCRRVDGIALGARTCRQPRSLLLESVGLAALPEWPIKVPLAGSAHSTASPSDRSAPRSIGATNLLSDFEACGPAPARPCFVGTFFPRRRLGRLGRRLLFEGAGRSSKHSPASWQSPWLLRRSAQRRHGIDCWTPRRSYALGKLFPKRRSRCGRNCDMLPIIAKQAISALRRSSSRQRATPGVATGGVFRQRPSSLPRRPSR